ncbi:MAG: alanine--glyoxylate aminotransferase family protein [Gemmatimonadaceae bacterium]
MRTFGTFFLPGPTEVRPEILAAMARPMIAHRGVEFEELFARIEDGLRGVFRTTRPVVVSSSSATGLMEAGVRCAPEGPILALVNGAFSERFAHIARACGRETDEVTAAWGTSLDFDEVVDRLRSRRYAAMTVVHSETSTGVLTDVRTLTRLARETGTLCLVDSVTGIAGAPLEFDRWDLDFVLTGSQKALALPPGLACAAASAEYMARARTARDRGLYFDLVEFEEYGAHHQTPNTPALPLLYALDAQLAAIRTEGIEARWERHEAMRVETERWVERLAADAPGWRVLAPSDARSPTVTAVVVPDGMRGRDIVAGVLAHGYTIGSGYGKLKDRTFRIGHMGDHTVEGVRGCLAACGDVVVRRDAMLARNPPAD